jgi:cation transport regulator ChaB
MVDFMYVGMWIVAGALTVWSIQRKMPWVRFKIRLSVILFSVALVPMIYAFVYQLPDFAGIVFLPSLIFLFLAAFALLKEQEDKHRDIEPTENAAQVADESVTSESKSGSMAPALIMWGAILLGSATYSYVSTLIGCPDGQNTGGSIVAEGEIQHSSVVNGMSCFWAVPLSGFWGVVGGLSGLTLLILGIVRLRASKR